MRPEMTIVGRLLMWQAAGVPPIIVQYTDVKEFQTELRKIADETGWIMIRKASAQCEFEEHIKASSVIHYAMEVWG